MINIILCSYKGDKYIQAQRESILGQKTDEEFRLYEYDDEIRQSGSAALNFLSAITEAPEAAYYMLSDQDDVWHPDKIEKLSAFIKANDNGLPLLCFSDAAVADESLNIIADSFVKYQGISPERTDFNHLLLQNQVTGAACIFNNALRNKIIEHEVPQHAAVHDHWIALIASAFGRILYLDEALYDYRQHDNNVLGAHKAGVFRETSERMTEEGSKKSHAGYESLFSQAQEFLEFYRKDMSPDMIEACEAFIEIPNLTKAEKIKTIARYGFTYNNAYRTFGEILFI
ncbi:MAG: hypothetical protein Q4E54_03970 [Lachnospiraceae bacterium]|nr:hypothetical protein [Lachnospiraceae bacterium]